MFIKYSHSGHLSGPEGGRDELTDLSIDSSDVARLAHLS